MSDPVFLLMLFVFGFLVLGIGVHPAFGVLGYAIFVIGGIWITDR